MFGCRMVSAWRHAVQIAWLTLISAIICHAQPYQFIETLLTPSATLPPGQTPAPRLPIPMRRAAAGYAEAVSSFRRAERRLSFATELIFAGWRLRRSSFRFGCHAVRSVAVRTRVTEGLRP
jgi:hypothetical protein